MKNRQLIDEYDGCARKVFLDAYGDTKNPEFVRYVQHLSKPTTRIFYGAPVFILVFESPDVIDENDCALAAGLGSDTEFLKEVGVAGRA